MSAAHFPVPKDIESFEFGRVKGITKTAVAQLLDFRWLDNHENLLFFGPPGLGKTHLSISLAMKAVEHGYTPIDRKEANLFFNLVSELYEKESIIITFNKGFESWAEMMGDSVMTTALLDWLLHHARVFTLDGESYRIHRKKEEK